MLGNGKAVVGSSLPPVLGRLWVSLDAAPPSYARKLVTVTSGGVFDWLDPVLEWYSFDELGEVA